MELSRQSPVPARFTGIGIVIAVHVAAITALSLGFINQPAKPKEPNIPVIPKDIKKPEPPERPPIAKAQEPKFPLMPRPDIPPPPDIVVDTPPPITIVEGARPEGPPPTTGGTTGGTGTPPVVVAQEPPRVQRPGAVCSVMPRPDVPAVSWTGEAVLQVMATVRGGRVVGSEFRVTQGALDAKSRRALQHSVATALAGYQCQGDAVFQQDFAFRLE